YVADDISGLQIIDISNPTTPTLKGNYDNDTGVARGVQIVGNYAYLADDGSGLQIIDISNPTNPTLKGNYDTSGSANGVQIVGNYAYLADGHGGLKIIDVSEFTSPQTVTLSISPSSVSEDGTANMAYTFTRSGVTTDALTVNYTVGGTATFSTDYTQSGAATFTITTGTVTFAANSTTAKVTIDPTADTTVEDDETVALTLASGTGYTVGTTTPVTGTITNDDVAFTIAAASSSRTEGNSGSKAFTFTVTRLIPPGNTTGSNNVSWAVTGTGTNPANAADFVGGVLPSGVVSFAPGETSKVITVNVQGDTTVEPNENFTVTLSNPTNGATLGTPSTATVTIVDDDGSVPFLVDIRPGAFSSYPKNLTAVGSTLYFIADDDVNGYELWKSDGTVAGTVAVADIRSPGNLTAVGNTLFFTARDGLNGTELWKSDGTAAGTVLVKDIRPGSSSSSPYNLTAVGNTLFFNANDGVNGPELWKSDGTAAGTVLVKDIIPGWLGSIARYLTAVGSTLFFSAYSEVASDVELWKSDGTAAGTVRVKDIWPGSFFASSNPSNLTAVGNTLYFTANDGVNGEELWKSDGTAAGTVLVKDSNLSFFLPNLTAVGNTLYFTAYNGVYGRELWKSDGTAAGTVLVKDIPNSSLHPRNLTAVGNTLYLAANPAFDEELWKSDGTAAGTVLVADIRPGAGSSSFPSNLTAVGSTLYFTANDGVNGYELWKSDGTAAGTVLVADIIPGASGYSPSSLTVVGNTLFFTANNGVNGDELWALNVSGPAVPTLTIAATSANQTEGNSGSKAFTFTVTRSVNTTGTNNVSWAVTGTGTNPANATDFVGSVLPSGTVSFAAGETSKVITVDVQGDTTVELNENFTVTLSNATNGATITTATATGTIENDDISVTPIEAFGNTKLVQDATNKLYAQIGNNNPIAIKNGATHIATNTYPGWQILAAETVNGVN
ncbi:ELWxxDGT repeat protein, partial [Microcystis sp. T1-4]|uniref:ELWxxDGT repeat protein n=1 Tax=Microcystis sp. T1-4 TaxID=1160279 RepID=UPI0026F38631